MVVARRTVCTKSGFLRIFKTQYGTVFISLSLFFFSRFARRPLAGARVGCTGCNPPRAPAGGRGDLHSRRNRSRTRFIRHSAVAAVLVVVVQPPLSFVHGLPGCYVGFLVSNATSPAVAVKITQLHLPQRFSTSTSTTSTITSPASNRRVPPFTDIVAIPTTSTTTSCSPSHAGNRHRPDASPTAYSGARLRARRRISRHHRCISCPCDGSSTSPIRC